MRRCIHGSTFLPPFAPRPLRRFIARTGALTPGRATFRLVADPRPGLPASLAPPSRRSVPNHPRAPRRHLCALSATGFLSVLGFTLNGRLAAHVGRIGFTLVTDRRSPPVALHPASRRRSYSRFQARGHGPHRDSHPAGGALLQAHRCCGRLPSLASLGLAFAAERRYVRRQTKAPLSRPCSRIRVS
jgi:hypothetical protein